MTASIGIVNVARLARVPILPLTYATSRRRVLATWDRFHLALPFGRGDPPLEHARRLVEERMVEMVREADRRVGHAESPSPIAADAGGQARPIAGE